MGTKIFTGLVAILLMIVTLTMTNYFFRGKKKDKSNAHSLATVSDHNEWKAPDTTEIPHTGQGDLIRYGRELILHTSVFFGPRGIVAPISNGMNCENCHVDAGTRAWGNNFLSVAATYPLFRNRSGKVETLEMRIDDCFERSLDGKKPGDSGREMKAMIAYIYWLGKKMPKGLKAKNSGTESVFFMERAADTLNGKKIYFTICRNCHGDNGGGKLADSGKEYLFPPLWGPKSYNVSAGMYQLSKFAGFVKNNMPLGSTQHIPLLSSTQAWDVAAFVNSKPRPVKYFKSDWPDISTKPADYPFGPYSDTFSAMQHKYGPFGPIQRAHRKSSSKI